MQTIKVTGGGQTLTMTRTADGKWQLAERGGYPADYKKARELALGLANLQLVEAKTAKADRLARLELGDPAKPDAKSHQVDLLDKDGKTLATAIVGKTKYGLYGGGRSGVYVRRGGEDQAWLAAGELSVPSSPTDVVSRDIIDIPQDEIGRVTLGADGPAPIVAAKADRNAPSYALEPPPPEGRKADEEKVNRLAGTLSSLTMQDVKPIAEVTFPPDAPKARFETWDGIDVDVRAATTGEGDKAEHWMSFTVAAGEPLAPAPAPAEGQPAPEARPGACGRAEEQARRLGLQAFRVHGRPHRLEDGRPAGGSRRPVLIEGRRALKGSRRPLLRRRLGFRATSTPRPWHCARHSTGSGSVACPASCRRPSRPPRRHGRRAPRRLPPGQGR